MAITPANLWPMTRLSTTATLLITSTNITQVKKVTFTNIDTSAHTFTVYIVSAADVPRTGNIVISTMTLMPGQSYIASELTNLTLTRNMSIYALSSSVSAINSIGSGFTQ